MQLYYCMIVGVYILHNGILIDPESNLAITAIGIVPSGHLICVTDKKPCCKGQNDHSNNWIFPGGGWVMSYSSMPMPTDFRRDRSNAGEINLYRLNTDVTSPTGRFCCVAIDATETEQMHCIHLGKVVVNVTILNTDVIQ